MAGILGFLGGDQPQGGILSGAQAAPNWASSLGLIGAALKDAASSYNGRDSNNVGQFQDFLRQNQLRQAYALAANGDPTQRQQAYGAIVANGGDPSGLQKFQASQALPQLLQNLQPSMGFNDNPVGVTPAVNATGPDADAARAAALQTNAGPAMSMQPSTLAGALQRTDSPELKAEFALPMIQAQIAAQAKDAVPYTLKPGEHRFVGTKEVASLPEKNNPNQPFNADGSPNKAFQDWELKKSRASGAVSSAAGWQLLVDPKTNTPYRYNVRTGQALDLSGNAYAPEGVSHVSSGQARSAASLAAQRFLQEHPDATAQDVAQFAADFGSTGKAVSSFGTGKQGDLIRSFNVGISHLNTLDGLVDALGNNDMQAFNKFGNAVAAQTGNPAPTNFDAAKAIVGDEIIKAIVGGGGALADRENAQNQIDRANSPQQLRGVINTYKKLMAGQLGGLKKQYTDTTHRGNFDSRLSPEARAELENETGSASPPPLNPQSLPRIQKPGQTKTGVKFQILGQ